MLFGVVEAEPSDGKAVGVGRSLPMLQPQLLLLLPCWTFAQDTYALVPHSNCTKLGHTICYQGSQSAIDNVVKIDPLACKPPFDDAALLAVNCSTQGFSKFVGHDPIFQNVQLWKNASLQSKALAPPSTYWMSTPTLENETVLIAGAGMSNARAMLCLDEACTNPFGVAPAVSSWNHSLSLTLPASCGPPCYVQITAESGGAVVLQINSPEPWFALSSAFASPAAPLSMLPTVSTTVTAGDAIRIFGRALAWADDRCVSGSARPTPSASTTLELTCAHASLVLAASGASCWEAAFPTASTLPAGECMAVVRTPRGVSAPLSVRVLQPIHPPPPTVLDVVGSYGGDLLRALAKAAQLGAHGGAVVELGTHAYELCNTRLQVPANTTLRGNGAAHTSISVSMDSSAPPGRSVVSGNGSRWSLLNFSLTVRPNSTAQTAAVFIGPGGDGVTVRGLTIRLEQPNVGSAFVLDSVRGVELVGNVVRQTGTCTGGASRVFEGHRVERVRIAENDVGWSCAVFSFDVSDGVVIEDNFFNGSSYREGDPTGNGLWTYDIHRHGVRPSSSLWSIARNAFIRPDNHSMAMANFMETLTTDDPHSFNMGVVAERLTVLGQPAVRLAPWPRVNPPVGATIVVLGDSGAGQSRLVTRVVGGGVFEVHAAFDAWLIVNVSKVAALPTVGRKLVVGNHFRNAGNVQTYGNAILDVHADNTIEASNVLYDKAAIGDATLGSPMALVGLCYKGAPGQVFFADMYNNTMVESNGLTLLDNFNNNKMNDCAAKGWWAGPWIRWAALKHNAFSGVSKAARYVANQTKTTPRCATVTVRAAMHANTTDILAERQVFGCPDGMLPGGYDVVGCEHCKIGHG